MSLKSSYITYSAEETELLGQTLAHELRGYKILLFGDLGAGKTTLIRGLAAGLGVVVKVKSPTFVYEKVYDIQKRDSSSMAQNDNGELFIHFDLYRLEAVDMELAEHLKEAFQNSAATVAVEWSERLSKELLPKQRVELKLVEGADGIRKISSKVFA